MNQEWQNVKVKLGMSSQANHDFYIADFGSRMTLMEALKNRPLAKESLSEQLKKIKKQDDTHESQSVFVSYEGKGGLSALILSGNASAFSDQEALRKIAVPVFNQEQEDLEINVNLLGLSDSHAEKFLSWIVSFAYLTRFRTPVFGKKESEQKKLGLLTLHIQTSLNSKFANTIIEEAKVLGVANNQVRYLADLPSNVLNPKSYVEKVQKIAKELKVSFRFIDKRALQKRNAGAFLAVVKADLNDQAGIVHLHYSGSKANGGKAIKKGAAQGKTKKVALVGKGLCFDTGGYNVKVGDYMYSMHRDMTGSAVALSLFSAMVELQVPYEVNAYLALAENLISHEGYRPNDVVVASNGMSIEVVDTDAEGRMVLSDTLVLASEEKPDLILDFATLTGSVIRSLDTRRSGVYSTDLNLSQSAVQVGERCGERVWNFPIGEDYNESIKSEIADVRQCASSNAADHIYAATFLSKFVGKNIPWMHVDLAASSNKGGLGLVATETTGFGVRFAYELVRQFFADHQK